MRLEGDENAVTDVIKHLATIRLLACGNIHETGTRHAATIGSRAKDAGEIVQACGREGQTVIRAIQPRAVCDRRHFDGRLGAVGK
ncbi:hypothetical protein D3C72_2302860 [compost metagenome]